MITKSAALASLFALLVATSCAKASDTTTATGPNEPDGTADAGPDGAPVCETCDSDGDGVPDPKDQCANTPAGSKVNAVGCADSQLTPKVEAIFPSYGLTWGNTGDLGRVGGLTWTYSGIQRGDLFHIWWVVCDDPAQPCAMSLHGPIAPSDDFLFDATDSDLTNGKVVFTNTSNILLAADGGLPLVNGRLTVNIVDAQGAAIPFATVASLGIAPRAGRYGAEIKGTAFKVTAIAEVQDPATSTWTPYLDYYDAAATPDTGDAGGNAFMSFGGSFYDK